MGQKTVFFGLSLCLCICCIGCSNDVFDPKQIGFGHGAIPVENIILDTLGVVDEPLHTYANAREPLPEDIIPIDRDYVFGSGDLVRISIYELREEGVPFIDDYIVTETGKISIPDVGILYASGLTETGLEQEIKDILSPDILISPSVKVMLNRSESQLFSIEGEGVNRSSRYIIPRYNFRLLDALAIAGGVAQFNVSYVYVTRKATGVAGYGLDTVPGRSDVPGGATTPSIKKVIESKDATGDDGLFELITPSYSMGFTGKSGMVVSASEMISDQEHKVLAALNDYASKPAFAEISDDKSDSGQVEWVFENGKYVPVSVAKTGVSIKPAKTKLGKKLSATIRDDSSSFGWDKMSFGVSQSRVIKIPVDKLFGGDLQYNILIRAGDVIRVPVDVVGEFYVMGNFNNQGAINLTGRPMTLVMAVAAAGGLGELAVPTKVEITRRIGRNRQVIVMVNLKKIAAGLQPDFFIKPNDLINVGTNGSARFLSVLRNAFRATYGFGFVYDRNFVGRDFGNF